MSPQFSPSFGPGELSRLLRRHGVKPFLFNRSHPTDECFLSLFQLNVVLSLIFRYLMLLFYGLSVQTDAGISSFLSVFGPPLLQDFIATTNSIRVREILVQLFNLLVFVGITFEASARSAY